VYPFVVNLQYHRGRRDCNLLFYQLYHAILWTFERRYALDDKPFSIYYHIPWSEKWTTQPMIMCMYFRPNASYIFWHKVSNIKPLEFNKKDVNYPIKFLNETPRGIAIARSLDQVKTGKSISRQHFNLSFVEWNDCESAKSNRMSKFPLWIFTFTILRAGEHQDSPLCTYPVAIGPKGQSHKPVEAILKEDLVQLRTTANTAFFGWSKGETIS
jgi:hypothetical protein